MCMDSSFEKLWKNVEQNNLFACEGCGKLNSTHQFPPHVFITNMW